MLNTLILKLRGLNGRTLFYVYSIFGLIIISIVAFFLIGKPNLVKNDSSTQNNNSPNLALKLEPLSGNQNNINSPTPEEAANITAGENNKKQELIKNNKTSALNTDRSKKSVKKENSKPATEKENETKNVKVPNEEMINLINRYRQENGLKPVKVNPLLAQAAAVKSKDMAENNYFAHLSPNGQEETDILANLGYEYNSLGVNIAKTSDDTDQAAFNLWVDSPGHRANLLLGFAVEAGYGRYGDCRTLILAEPAK